MITKKAFAVAFAITAIGIVVACSSDNKNNNTAFAGQGLCMSTCAKPCSGDQECNTNLGELCCDYGNGGKICQNAKACPKFCENDSTCETSTGQACVRRSLTNEKMVCAPAATGLKLCQADGDCALLGQICCQIYNQAICMPANRCPKGCTTSTDCQTSTGEICCTSANTLEPSLRVPGVCLNPAYEPCPKPCSTSQDCATTSQLCCNGVCASTCPKQCQENTDCTGQICCKTYNLVAPSAPKSFRVTPGPRSGRPTATSA
jgi:hypothetical protein